MSTLQMTLLGAAVVLVLIWWLVRQRASSPARAADDRIDTLIGWPPQPTRVLTTRERIAFGILMRALPDYMILAQVPVSRFLSVPKRHSYADWLRRLGHQCIDFAVCDMAAQVLAVVELQPQGGSASERARKRIARMARSLKAAHIPLLVWPENGLPSIEAAREAVLALARKPAASPAAAALPVQPEVATSASTTPMPPLATDAPNPFNEAGRDSTHDEMIELLEPPPSTWFDDLDSGPTPLRKD